MLRLIGAEDGWHCPLSAVKCVMWKMGTLQTCIKRSYLKDTPMRLVPTSVFPYYTMVVPFAFIGVLVTGSLASPLFTELGPMDLFKRASSSCGSNVQTSCHNSTRQTNLCCFEAPGVRFSVSQSFVSTDGELCQRAFCCRHRFDFNQVRRDLVRLIMFPVLGHRSFDWSFKQLDYSWCVLLASIMEFDIKRVM